MAIELENICLGPKALVFLPNHGRVLRPILIVQNILMVPIFLVGGQSETLKSQLWWFEVSLRVSFTSKLGYQ
jgi:hypothetical protein